MYRSKIILAKNNFRCYLTVAVSKDSFNLYYETNKSMNTLLHNSIKQENGAIWKEWIY